MNKEPNEHKNRDGFGEPRLGVGNYIHCPDKNCDGGACIGYKVCDVCGKPMINVEALNKGFNIHKNEDKTT